MEQAMLIRDHKQTILNLLQEGKALMESAGDKERAAVLEKNRQETEAKTSPTMMFYGLYNAGKSTIINALCQDDVAPVGDVPTTTEIQRIHWKGYTLIDTPGIDACTEHTKIAEKEIRESDVVLFVMDNADTFDNALVYRTIVNILDMGKPLAVIINQKNIDEEEDINIPVPEQASMRNIVKKVSLNLETQGRRSSAQLVAQRRNYLGIFPLNGLMAFSARQQTNADGREGYLGISGITSLKNALDPAIAHSQQVYMLQTPLINLRDTLRQAAEEFQASSIYGEKQQMAKNREALLLSRQRLRDRLLADGLRKIEATIEQMNASAAAGQRVEDPSQKLKEELQALLREAAEQEKAVLQSTLTLEAMPGYQPEEASATNQSEKEGFDLFDLLADVPIIIDGPGFPIPIPGGVIVKLVKVLFKLIFGDSDSSNQQAAAESQERLANYYRWRNEMRDQEIKIKAVYEKSVNDFLAQVYDPQLAEIDRILADVDKTCAKHTETLRELEQLQLRVSDEMVALAVS